MDYSTAALKKLETLASMDYSTAVKKVETFTANLDKQKLQDIGKVAAAGFAVYYVGSKLYDAFLGPLSGIPGPFIAKFTGLPQFLYNRPSGTLFENLLTLHDKYGKIVRVSPTMVQIADKDWINQVLQKQDLPKGPLYKLLAPSSGKATLFSTRDKVFHKQRRRIVSPAFSVKYLNSLEVFMDSATEALVRKIDSDIKQNSSGEVDIWILLQCLALDIIGETAFGQTFNMIENNSHFVPVTITERMRFASMMVNYPWIGTIARLLSMDKDPKLTKFMQDVIVERLHTNTRRDDILQILIDTQNAEDQEDRLTAEAIISEVVLFLIAGSETTSNTTGFAIVELLRHPEVLAKLREEIDSVPMNENQKVFHHDQIKHLPYLNAVINETMRLNSIAANGIQRVTTEETTLGQEVVLPKNTAILCQVQHAQLNPEYWPEADQFKPERWLEDAVPKPSTDAFFPFSIGTRNCIGKNFALQEMRITIATLVKLYDMKPIPQELKDAEQRRHFITLTVAKNSFKLLMKRREATTN
ncbi:cytochrome P450 [Radiomyces spectabilis]|uniref:cytochrome P450 n=1 Tax=Radiomyces spectabilis TaxID=64574 RepID=UPI002220B8CE|nr:cytochrome P450 [Radiomyces spectabilis]KAI8379333.1 cytochrome P450 [Radiomyces spectabilis]